MIPYLEDIRVVREPITRSTIATGKCYMMFLSGHEYTKRAPTVDGGGQSAVASDGRRKRAHELSQGGSLKLRTIGVLAGVALAACAPLARSAPRPLSVRVTSPELSANVDAAAGMGLTAKADVRTQPADNSQPALRPRQSFTIPFPDLPPTFEELVDPKGIPPQMTVFLPKNYDPARKHPLLIFLNGGAGGRGGNPGVARALTEDTDFICVNLPLFHQAAPGSAGYNFIIREADGKYMWPLHKRMLAELERTVPNIDPARRIIGGFSNGAHSVAALIDGSDGEIARLFSAFWFVEGGGRMKRFELLRGKPYLMVSSNAKSRPRAQQICDTAKAAGVLASFVYKDVGKHDFPTSAYPAVREWLFGQINGL